MNFRKIISLSIAFSFIILFITGIFSFTKDYSRITATIHTVFGFVFAIGVAFHLFNNFQPLKKYGKGIVSLLVLTIGALLLSATYFLTEPFHSLMDYGTRLKANTEKNINSSQYDVLQMPVSNGNINLTIDLLQGEHYWHPQMAVWIEDAQGNYTETLFVTKATAKGIFYGGRSKANFKEFDGKKGGRGDYRRVNALPVWSHKRGVLYEDKMYVPTRANPLPDAITGATFKGNFKLLTAIDELEKFTLKIELNVAFDDNEYYSEYDFPDDDIFHSGTGQLGQPSIIFEAHIDMVDNKKYYLMEMIGHGHRSGQTGELFTDVSSLTTALDIVERIVVGVK
ncbi:MAG: hypothetical protein AAFO07_04410 [Bacteroidota bacterium]